MKDKHIGNHNNSDGRNIQKKNCDDVSLFLSFFEIATIMIHTASSAITDIQHVDRNNVNSNNDADLDISLSICETINATITKKSNQNPSTILLFNLL
jgi:hypothetical protein